ncbi:MAG: hypothetical protein BGO87_15075 [Flavobacteriia bacterium 40-80]|nr:MAG: hypothetical protein BGO87_15075 [Flavobacteriia bacterium 40-80]
MKKNFLYVSFFAAAILVSCKSKEAEETPAEEIVTEEVIVEEPVQDEAPVAEEKAPEATNTTKKVTKKEEKTVVLKTEEVKSTPSSSKITEMKQAKEVSGAVEEVKTEGKKINEKLLKAKEEKEKANSGN